MKLGHKIIALIMLFLTAASVVIAEKNGLFRVERVRIEMRASPNLYWSDRKSDLNLRLEDLNGKNIWSYSISSLKEILESEPWVGAYKVTRSFPNIVKLTITPERVVAIGINKKGHSLPITANGKKLPSARLLRSPVAPVVRGSSRVFDDDGRRVKLLSRLLSEVPDRGAFALSDIDEVSFDNDETIWLHLLKSRIDIRLGKRDFPLKLSRVSEVIEYMKSEELTDRVIDAEFSQKVLVRPRKRR